MTENYPEEFDGITIGKQGDISTVLEDEFVQVMNDDDFKHRYH